MSYDQMTCERPKLYVYKITVDSNAAPCVHRGLLSLAICKPQIRKYAGEGSVIFGFGGRAKDYKERLIYVARITEKLDPWSYYTEPKYASRPDCIYQEVDGKAKIKSTAKYHADGSELKTDVGIGFEKAYVLLSRDFRYFGANGTANYKLQLDAVRKLVEEMGRAYRTTLNEEVYQQLIELQDCLWTSPQEKKVPPTEPNSRRSCNRVEGMTAVCCSRRHPPLAA
jgi:hypothetical protein